MFGALSRVKLVSPSFPALSSPPLSSPFLTLPFLRMSFCSKSVTQPPVKSQNEWNRSGEFKIKFVQLIRLALSRSLSTELIELPDCLLALAIKTTRLRNSRLYFFFSVHVCDWIGKPRLAIYHSLCVVIEERKWVWAGIYVTTLEVLYISKEH